MNDYREFLKNQMVEFLENIPLAARKRMVFIYDGAPVYFSRVEMHHTPDLPDFLT